MNKYVVRTSLVWLALIAVGMAFCLYEGHKWKRPSAAVSEVQPAAVGSAPEQSTDKPGETKAPNMHDVAEAPLAPVQLTPDRLQSIGVQTGRVEWKEINDDIRATGTVDIDERLNAYVQVRFSGYIRKVFANATYQYVKKGEPLFTIYSPDLLATQHEYLLARRSEMEVRRTNVEDVSSDAVALISAAEDRLRQSNIPETDIAKLKETNQPVSDLTIDSPVSGYITERNALPNLYVEPASRLYAISDLSRVWIYAQVFQEDIGRIKPNDQARITVDAFPGRTFHGRIESILPQVDMATRTVRVRLEVPNPDVKLKPGMFVNALFTSTMGRGLVVPASAILQSGRRQLAFVDEGGGRLTPKDVVLGATFGDQVVVMQGLSAGQRIVTSANFLIDSESQLQAAAGSYVPPAPGVGATGSQPTQTAPLKIDFSTDPDPPMRGHNSLRVKLADGGGKPIDGAGISVILFMPAMPAMGMAAITVNEQLKGAGNGLYQGRGVLSSGGPYQVRITVQKNGQVIGSKQLQVNATGGM